MNIILAGNAVKSKKTKSLKFQKEMKYRKNEAKYTNCLKKSLVFRAFIHFSNNSQLPKARQIKGCFFALNQVY